MPLHQEVCERTATTTTTTTTLHPHPERQHLRFDRSVPVQAKTVSDTIETVNSSIEMAKVLSPCSSLLLACLFLLELQGCYSKQLVLFAGPHKCGSTSVERFFHNYVSGYNHAPKLEALEGWTWPPIEGNIVEDMSFQKHKVFNFLVTEPTDMTLQNRIIKVCERAATQFLRLKFRI